MKPLWTFFLLAFGISWCIELPLAYQYQHHQLSQIQADFWHLFGGLGPFLGALITTRMHYGTEGLKKFLKHFRLTTLTDGLYALSPLLILGVALVIYPVIFGHFFDFTTFVHSSSTMTAYAFWTWLSAFFLYGLLEEPGWRGFALPHLQQKYSALTATVLLTVAWALWHLPMFFYRFQFSVPIYFGFFASMLVGAILLTHTFNSTRGSILAVMLWHTLYNLTSALDKENLIMIISALQMVWAGYILIRFRFKDLSGRSRIGNYLLTQPTESASNGSPK